MGSTINGTQSGTIHNFPKEYYPFQGKQKPEYAYSTDCPRFDTS